MASTSSENGSAKKKMAPVQVYLRIRPSIPQDGQLAIVSCTPKEIQMKGHNKSFSFDGIFDQKTSQARVYKTVASKMIFDVMKGYNCTVFAYGQTGTGKTHTILGSDDKILTETPNSHWSDESNAGISLRAISHLYEELNKLDPSIQRSVTVSFLEIYNEEIRDLLCDKEGPALRIYEDKSKMVRVKNLFEITVLNPQEIFALLKKGCEKRKVAATLMNQHSSRSHSVFTINVSIIHNISIAENLSNITTGKLNLVDLAGSENIGRSGSKEMRAREATNINQSLLTLGRVIKALVENSSHVPYRESKLTRILQDSLGGKTKTSIIATISPGVLSLEETMNTLDYAYNARHITNCPTINSRSSASIAAAQEEISKLKRDLFAMANEKGIYMDKENYEEMTKKLDQYRKDMLSYLGTIKQMSEQINDMESQKEEWESLRESCEFTRQAYQQCSSELEQKKRENEKDQLLLKHYEKESEKLQEITEMMERRDHHYHEKLSKVYAKSRQNRTILEKVIETVEFKMNGIVQLNNENSAEFTENVNSLKDFHSEIGQILREIETKLNAQISFNGLDAVQVTITEEDQQLEKSIEALLVNLASYNNGLFDQIYNEVDTKSRDSQIAIEKLNAELNQMKKSIENHIHKYCYEKKENEARVNEQNNILKTNYDSIIQKKMEIEKKKRKCAELDEKLMKLVQEIDECRREICDDEKILDEQQTRFYNTFLLNNVRPSADLEKEYIENCRILNEKFSAIPSLERNGSNYSRVLNNMLSLQESVRNFKNSENKKIMNETKNTLLSQVHNSNKKKIEVVQNVFGQEMAFRNQLAGMISRMAEISASCGGDQLDQLIEKTDSHVESLAKEIELTKRNIQEMFKNFEPVTSTGDTPVKLNQTIVKKRSSRDSILRKLIDENVDETSSVNGISEQDDS